MEGWFDKLVAYTISRGSVATLVQFGYFISVYFSSCIPRTVDLHLVYDAVRYNTVTANLDTLPSNR
jgi:hypothetical protein